MCNERSHLLAAPVVLGMSLDTEQTRRWPRTGIIVAGALLVLAAVVLVVLLATGGGGSGGGFPGY